MKISPAFKNILLDSNNPLQSFDITINDIDPGVNVSITPQFIAANKEKGTLDKSLCTILGIKINPKSSTVYTVTIDAIQLQKDFVVCKITTDKQSNYVPALKVFASKATRITEGAIAEHEAYIPLFVTNKADVLGIQTQAQKQQLEGIVIQNYSCDPQYLFSKSDISCTATLVNKATIPLSYDFIAKTAPIFPITGEAVTTRIDSGIVMFPAQTKKISFKVPTTNSLLGKNQLTFQIVSTNEFLPAALVNSTNYTYYYVSAILVGICIPLGVYYIMSVFRALFKKRLIKRH